MPVTINDFFDKGPDPILSLTLCEKLIKQSVGMAVNGNPNVGHADQHIVSNDGFGHLGDDYRERESHSMFASAMDAVVGLYSFLASSAGRFALVQLKRRRTTRVVAWSQAEPGATMRVNMGGVLPGMPVTFDYDTANIRLVMDVDLASGRLHVQSLFPVKDLDKVLQANKAPGGTTARQVVEVESGTYYWNDFNQLGSKPATEVSLASFKNIKW